MKNKLIKLEFITQYIIGVAVLCIILLVNIGVVSRILLIPASWTDEVLQIFVVWMVFIASAIAFRVDCLISFELFEEVLKKKPLAHKILKLIQSLFVIIFVFFMVTQTYSIVHSLYVTDEVSPVMGFPLWIKNLGYFLGCALFCVFGVLDLFDRIRAFKSGGGDDDKTCSPLDMQGGT